MNPNKSTIAIATLVLAILVISLSGHTAPTSTKTSQSGKEEVRQRLSQVKVASLYENVTDGVAMGRSVDETARLLKETHTDFVFRGFWKWAPIVDSPDEIPHELLKLVEDKRITAKQASEAVRQSGHYYGELKRTITAIKKEMPNLIFCGAIPAQTLCRVEWNPVTDRVYGADDTWKMALDPAKWNIKNKGKLVTKEQFQEWWYGVHPYGGALKTAYDRRKVTAYFPDITNPDFQELLVAWAKKQIDCGADAIWIDMLETQALHFVRMTGDIKHPAVKASVEAASKVVDEIHKYGRSKGRYVLVGGWAYSGMIGGRVLTLPYPPPALDFVTKSPSAKEVRARKLDAAKWDEEIPAINALHANVPIFSFIDWGFDESQTVSFSQELSKDEQRDFLRQCDDFFAKRGVNFVYPLHGGYMGRGAVTKRLAFGKYRFYDSLAPEFDTYATIKELAQAKK
jgi:hypothetical protein